MKLDFFLLQHNLKVSFNQTSVYFFKKKYQLLVSDINYIFKAEVEKWLKAERNPVLFIALELVVITEAHLGDSPKKRKKLRFLEDVPSSLVLPRPLTTAVQNSSGEQNMSTSIVVHAQLPD